MAEDQDIKRYINIEIIQTQTGNLPWGKQLLRLEQKLKKTFCWNMLGTQVSHAEIWQSFILINKIQLFFGAFFRSAITATKSTKRQMPYYRIVLLITGFFCRSLRVLLLQKPTGRVGLKQELLHREPCNPMQESFYPEEQSSLGSGSLEPLLHLDISLRSIF